MHINRGSSPGVSFFEGGGFLRGGVNLQGVFSAHIQRQQQLSKARSLMILYFVENALKFQLHKLHNSYNSHVKVCCFVYESLLIMGFIAITKTAR